MIYIDVFFFSEGNGSAYPFQTTLKVLSWSQCEEKIKDIDEDMRFIYSNSEVTFCAYSNEGKDTCRVSILFIMIALWLTCSTAKSHLASSNSKLRYHVHFQINIFGKVMNSLIPAAMRLKTPLLSFHNDSVGIK